MNDRIKIAEAMGYAFIPLTDSWLTPCGKRTVKKLPDPFTSADDDYAVLEWMRGSDNSLQSESFDFIIFGNAVKHGRWYQIGDYARAYLRVIE